MSMYISDETIRRVERDYSGSVLLDTAVKERLQPGMKVLIKEKIVPRYSDSQNKYKGCVFTLKSRLQWGNGEFSERWWLVEENDTQWFYNEFYVIIPDEERNCGQYIKLCDPIEKQQGFMVDDYSIFGQMILDA